MPYFSFQRQTSLSQRENNESFSLFSTNGTNFPFLENICLLAVLFRENLFTSVLQPSGKRKENNQIENKIQCQSW